MRVIAFMVAAVLCAVPGMGSAQDSIALYGDTGDGLSRFVDTPTGTTTFDIVVHIDPVLGPDWVEFHMTKLENLLPGVFMVGYFYPGINSHTYSHTEVGEYDVVLNWGAPCMEAGPLEVARFTYLDMDGSIPRNTVLSLAPFGPDAVSVQNCPGTICYGECETGGYGRPSLRLRPWVDYDVIDPTWIPGVESSDGVLVLNPDAIAVSGEESSFGMLKSRY